MKEYFLEIGSTSNKRKDFQLKNVENNKIVESLYR